MIQIIAALCLAAALCCRFQRRFEYVLPPLMAAGMLLLTGLAMLQKLFWVDGLAVALLVAIGLWVLLGVIKGKIRPVLIGRRLLKHVLTPGFVCFWALLALFWLASEPMVVWWGDDFYHWALQPKSLWFYQGLVDASRHLGIDFATYTPGLQAVQWWVMNICGEWNEAALHFALFGSYAVFLMPLSGRLRWRKAYLMPLFIALCVILPIWGNQLSYVFLGIDTTLALCFGYALVQIWRMKEAGPLGLISIALSLCALVLIKQIGIVLAMMAAVLFFVLKRGKGHKPWAVLALLLAPAAVWGGWMLFCNAMGLSGHHTSETFAHIQSMLSGEFVLPKGINDIPHSIWNALTVPYPSEITLLTQPLFYVPRAVWLVVIAAAPLLLSFGESARARELRKASIFLCSMTAVYLLIQYFSFFTTFYTEVEIYTLDRKNNMVLLLERYMSPVLLGGSMLLWWMLMDEWTEQRQKGRRFMLGAVCALLCMMVALTANWDLLMNNLIPDQYIQHDRALGVEGEVMGDHDWGTMLEDCEEARVLVGLERNSDFVKKLRYAFAPAKFFLPELYFTQSADTLREYILSEGITHLICFDTASELYAPAEALAGEDGFYGYELYEVAEMEGQVMLVEF